jgi:hypothetical protein
VCFDVTDQLLIRFSVFVKYWRKKREYNKTIHQLFIDFKKAYDSVRREVLYSILIEFGVPMAETRREYKGHIIKYFVNCCEKEGIIIYS